MITYNLFIMRVNNAVATAIDNKKSVFNAYCTFLTNDNLENGILLVVLYDWTI